MIPRQRAWPALLLLCSAAAPAPPAADEPGPILAPPPAAAFPAGPVRFIGRGKGQLKLDGQAVSTESPHDGVQTIELKPAPGAHEIEFEGARLRFFSGVGAPAAFVPFRPHPPAGQCDTCHAVRNGNWRFTRVSLGSVCAACHARETFPAKHTHELAVLTDCQLCHNPHGSTTAAHLKLTRDAACKQCHALQ